MWEYGPGLPTATYFALMAVLKRLRERREAAGLSLADVADRGRKGVGSAL